jgi:hypothetical protein
MASITTTTAANFNPTIWAKDAQLAWDNQKLLIDLINNVSGDFTKGVTYRIPLVSTMVANDVGADGSVAPQSTTENKVDLTINTWKESSIDIVDNEEMLSAYPLSQLYGGMAANALNLKVDSDIYSLKSSFTGTTVDSSAYKLNAANGAGLTAITQIVEYMDEAYVPQTGRKLVISPKAKKQLLDLTTLVQANTSGTTDALRNASVGNLFGLDIYEDPIVSTTAGTPSYDSNIAFHTDTMAIALRSPVSVEKLARTKLAQTYAWSVLYGKVCARPSTGFIWKTNAD